MKIFYGKTIDGSHLHASAQLANGEMTPGQRMVLCEVFSALCKQIEKQVAQPEPPKSIGSYVLVRVGYSNGKAFAEYARQGAS